MTTRAPVVPLTQSVQFLRGVGPARAREFESLGVRTVGDLLAHFPFRHEISPRSQPIGEVEPDRAVTVIGELRNVREKSGFSRTISAEIIDGTGRCRVRWFHADYLRDRLGHGMVVRLSGPVDLYNDFPCFVNPRITFLDREEDPLALDREEHRPVYPATSKLPSPVIASVIAGVLDSASGGILEFLPADVRERRRLPPRRTAFLRLHRPTSMQNTSEARRRIAYDELFLCQAAVQIARRKRSSSHQAPALPTGELIDARIRRRFPFELSPQQNQAIQEIRADINRSTSMHRLLQADVGAGKTAVGVYAALAAIAHRRQAAIIAPTEVLAEQHHSKIEQYLSGSRVRRGLLTGSTKGAARADLLRALSTGELDLIVGTHALLESNVRFANLGLVIIDEQHKFGVAQRAALSAKGFAPHVLAMTATPIPRSLAMTLYGDMDLSMMRGALPGRQPVVTRIVTPDLLEKAWTFVRSRLGAGQQAYVVYPLVEESEDLPLRAATTEVKRLASHELNGFRVGLLHGKMRSKEKAEVVRRFRSGELQALAATTVVEVGLDVANATMMVIQHAERYGLSQLHQLRGRIGRGSGKSFCFLFTEQRDMSMAPRLRILCETSDGFRIAEEDLRLRGPGELVGTRQHGIPAFKVADLTTDLKLLEEARSDAAKILRADPDLGRTEHQELRGILRETYGPSLGLE